MQLNSTTNKQQEDTKQVKAQGNINLVAAQKSNMDIASNKSRQKRNLMFRRSISKDKQQNSISLKMLNNHQHSNSAKAYDNQLKHNLIKTLSVKNTVSRIKQDIRGSDADL